MKTKRYILICIIVGIVIASFFMGRYTKQQEYLNSRKERCEVFISFALDKVENQDISDQNMMEAIISNVYAAYELCDDSVIKNQLHDLWNYIIFEEENYKDILLVELESIKEAIKSK